MAVRPAQRPAGAARASRQRQRDHPGPIVAFSQTYDGLGAVATVHYPFIKEFAGASTTAVSYGYSNGMLTTVSGRATVGYHPNGMVGTVTRSSGQRDVIELEPAPMGRPYRIAAQSPSNASLWSSGAVDPHVDSEKIDRDATAMEPLCVCNEQPASVHGSQRTG